MKAKFKPTLRVVRHSISGAVCSGAVLLMASGAPAQNLFEADGSSGNIFEFTTAGTKSTFASGLSDPLGLAFNSAGDLFETDYGSGKIYEFTQAGVRSTFASGLVNPEGLAFGVAGRRCRCNHRPLPPHPMKMIVKFSCWALRSMTFRF
jgi:hypothetical protein